MNPSPNTTPAGRALAIALALAGAVCLLAAAPVIAAPAWHLESLSNTTVAPGGTLDYVMQATSVGDAPMDGSQIDVVARLPDGVVAESASLFDAATLTTFSCADARDGVSPAAGASSIVCSSRTPVSTFQKLNLTVDVGPSVAGILRTVFTVSGGGAPSASAVDPVLVSDDPPGFGVDAFDGQVGDGRGRPYTQAGGHPADASVSIAFNTLTSPIPLQGSVWPVEPVKDVVTDLPPGFVGDPTSVDQCTLPDLAHSETGFAAKPLCAPTSQVGTALVRLKGTPSAFNLTVLPVYNLVPPPDVPARFGFNLLGSVVVLDGTVRNGGDYGITVTGTNVPAAVAVVGTTVELWGLPADASHDAERACPNSDPPFEGGPACRSGAALKPFLRNPTSCTDPGVGLPTTVHIDSWTHPGDFQDATFLTHEPPGYPSPPDDWGAQIGPTGCDQVPFDPALVATPQPAQAGSPSGFSFDLSLPQTDEPDIVGQSDLRSAVVTLPAGVRVSPSSAGGLQGCSSAQIALDDNTDATCPDGSKVGSVTIDTPLLADPVLGGIYLATPFDNEFRSLVAVYLVARAHGVVLKLAGQVSLNADTGQITTTFDDNPQLPFSRLHLEFKGGPRAPLTLPSRCGVYTTHAVLTGWNGRTVSSDSSFALTKNARGDPCPSTFSPGFNAGTASNRAGSSSSFSLRLTRDDEDQALSALTVSLPNGLTGKIANVAQCAEGDAARGTCSDRSQVGDVTVGAGAGSDPFFITTGRAYLTGPYKGAPFGLSIVVPAKAGPFDLGDVNVRSALFVDKHDATVRVVSDPLPTILQGIPLDVRDVRVNVNRPDFFVNPTSCAEKTIGATIESTEGASANVSDRFQAADCASLGFKPRMVMRVGGRGHTRRGQTSAFTTQLTMPPSDQANLRYVRVTLPTTINARLNTINDACTRAEFESDVSKCEHAVAGTATAVTPLLSDPLSGNVYFVKNGHPIPDLFVALRGQVAFDLIGRVSIPGGKHLATTFSAVPDVPVRSFTLRLLGGARTASIGAAANLCSKQSRRAKAAVDYIGQNGKVLQVDQPLEVGGCAKSKKTKRHKR